MALVTQESFTLNLFATDINPSMSEGSKLYLKATEELPKNERITVTLENGTIVRRYLELYRTKFTWGMLLSKVPDDEGTLKDVIKHYRSITLANVLEFNNTYLGDRSNSAPLAIWVMPDLDPANNPDHKIQFFKRVRSQMIAREIEGIINSNSWTQLMIRKKHFTWYTTMGEDFYDRVMMSYLLMDTCNPETKVSIQVLHNKITGTKSADYSYEVPKILDHISSTMDLITELGETYDSLLKDTFDALLSIPNTKFHQFFEMEKLRWESGKQFDFDSLSNIAKSIYNNMVSNQTWDSVDPKDAQIMALSTEVAALKDKQGNYNGLKTSKGKNSLAERSDSLAVLHPWRKINDGPKKFKDGVWWWWWWCEHHIGEDWKGLYIRHKLEDHYYRQ